MLHCSLFLPDWSCFLRSGTSKLTSLSNTSFWFSTKIYSIPAGFLFFLRKWATVTLIIRGLINFRLGSTDWEINEISFSPLGLPEELFTEMNFSKGLSSLKMLISQAFNIVSKLRSYSCNRNSWSMIYSYHT